MPIHWGTLQPVWWRRRSPDERREPAVAFAREAARLAPGVEVRILDAGTLESAARRGDRAIVSWAGPSTRAPGRQRRPGRSIASSRS